MNRFIIVCMSLFSLGCSVFGVQTGGELKYEVIEKDDKKEIRYYPSYIVARVTVDDKEDPDSSAFRILADYIFGKNKSKSQISMTAPVITAEQSEEISMTAPVIMKPEANNKMTMSFSMPSKYTMEELPEPIDKRVKLATVSEHYVAALKYSWFMNKDKNSKLAKKLKNWLKTKPNFAPVSDPYFAGYNPPWTIPFLRRNEVLIKLKKNEN